MNAANITRVYLPVVNGTIIDDYVYNNEIDALVSAHNLVVLDLQTLDDFLDVWNGPTGYAAKVDANVAGVATNAADIATNTDAIATIRVGLTPISSGETGSYSPPNSLFDSYSALIFIDPPGALAVTMPTPSAGGNYGTLVYITNMKSSGDVTLTAIGGRTFWTVDVVLSYGDTAICYVAYDGTNYAWALAAVTP